MRIEPLYEVLYRATTEKITEVIDRQTQFRFLRIIVFEICSRRSRGTSRNLAICLHKSKCFDTALSDLDNSAHLALREGRLPVTRTDGAGAVPVGGVRRS